MVQWEQEMVSACSDVGAVGAGSGVGAAELAVMRM